MKFPRIPWRDIRNTSHSSITAANVNGFYTLTRVFALLEILALSKLFKTLMLIKMHVLIKGQMQLKTRQEIGKLCAPLLRQASKHMTSAVSWHPLFTWTCSIVVTDPRRLFTENAMTEKDAKSKLEEPRPLLPDRAMTRCDAIFRHKQSLIVAIVRHTSLSELGVSLSSVFPS